MMQGLLQRHSTVLSRPEWLTQPWKNSQKSTEQKVYDYGLVLAGLFEAARLQFSIWRQECRAGLEPLV